MNIDSSEAFNVNGLRDDAEILVDRWGIPHIYAQTRLDAFVAQGFQAARDRLFQIDLWRRRGLGLLAEVLGPEYVNQDRATRLFLFRGDMRAEWISYSTDARDVIGAFVTGINSFVDWALEDPDVRIPPEFGLCGYMPVHWAPEDVVRIRTHGLLFNAEQELARALTLRDLGPQAEKFRSVREPSGPLDIPEPSLYDVLSDEVLDVYRQAFAPVNFCTATSSEVSAPSGSNNWAIAPHLSATGRPVLANDPHRAVTVPSLRYLAHLEAPGLSVIGAGEPNLPGISIGHNGRVAFGLTIWPVDHEDLYIYELHPDDNHRYQYRGAWEEFNLVEERSTVAGGDDIVHKLVFSRHGPVVYFDEAMRRAVAVRAAWLEPGMAPYLASLEYQDASDATEFRRALRRWGAPAVNQVFATTGGDIGWQPSAMVPRRSGWDGSLPVPGDGRYEWSGFASLEELPSVLNPSSGWFTSSNEYNIPDQDRKNNARSEDLIATTDWYSSARHERLVRWFDSGEDLDVESSVRMQVDAHNVHGRQMLDTLSALRVGAACEDVWSELQGWDGTESHDSRAALMFQIWQRRHLRPWLVERSLQRLGISSAIAEAGQHRLLRADSLVSDLRPDLRMIEQFDLNSDEDIKTLSLGVEQTLNDATTEIEKLLGKDRSTWTWGALHRTELRHPVLSGRPEIPLQWGALLPSPRSGSGDTVGLTGYDENFNAVMGSSFRMVVDVGSWDNTRVINSPGQSGDPRSSHYSDLLHLWAAGETFQLAYSRAAVESVADHRIILRPTRVPSEDER